MENIKEIAKAWCIYNGQKGTDKQVEKVLKQFKGLESNLIRMVQERNILK